MRAVTLDSFGGARVLHAAEVPVPEERAGWTVVRLQAAGLNWHDVLVRQGRYGSPLPHVLGADGAGIATDDGREVCILPSLAWGADESAPGPGWEILGDTAPGTYAEYVSVPTESLFPKPRSLDWRQAAALPLVGVTAFRALVRRGRLARGEHLLISGAGGGLAPMAVTIAAAVGARVVVTSSSAERIRQAVALGADGGVLHTDAGWPELARQSTPGGRGFDVVLDSVSTWADSLRALRPGGRLVVLGASRAEQAAVDVRRFYFGQYDLLGTTMGSPSDFRGLLGLVETGEVAPPPIDRAFPLDGAAEAHEHLEAGDLFGKIVLDIATHGGTP